MTLTDHCALCENQVIDFHEGTYCKLTSARPKFLEKCRDISLEQKLEKLLIDSSIELAKTKSTKAVAVTHMVIYITISIAIMVSSYLLSTYIFERGFISTVPLIIFGVGFLLLPVSFGPFNSYRQRVGVAQRAKDKIDNVLATYGVNYNMDISLGKEIHEEQKVDISLRLTKGRNTEAKEMSIYINNAAKTPLKL